MSRAENEGSPEEVREVTNLLRAIRDGDRGVESKLVDLVYTQLEKIAANRMRSERRDHTLEAGALVHEAWLRLRGDISDGDWRSRTHFFGAAASAMRRVLIDHARGKRAAKRGGERQRVALDESLDLAIERGREELLALEDAIQRLEAREPRVGKVVRLRFYAGLAVDDVAAALEVSRRTVLNDWSFARAWLYRELSADGDAARNDGADA